MASNRKNANKPPKPANKNSMKRNFRPSAPNNPRSRAPQNRPPPPRNPSNYLRRTQSHHNPRQMRTQLCLLPRSTPRSKHHSNHLRRIGVSAPSFPDVVAGHFQTLVEEIWDQLLQAKQRLFSTSGYDLRGERDQAIREGITCLSNLFWNRLRLPQRLRSC